MTFSYANPDTSQIDEVRFLLGDIKDAGHIIEDEEISYLLKKWLPLYPTVEWVASVAADTLASRYVREASYSADGVSISLGNLGKQYYDLAARLRAKHIDLLVGTAPDAGGITPGEEHDPNLVDTDFGTGMHDNPEAGKQNYGQRDYVNGWYNPYDMPGV